MNTLNPADKTRSEKLQKLQQAMQNKLANRVRNLTLVWHKNGLVIHGFVNTYYDKQIVQHTLLQSTEITLVANKIEVRKTGISRNSD